MDGWMDGWAMSNEPFDQPTKYKQPKTHTYIYERSKRIERKGKRYPLFATKQRTMGKATLHAVQCEYASIITEHYLLLLLLLLLSYLLHTPLA